MWSLNSFCGLFYKFKLSALTLNFEFSHLYFLGGEWMRGGTSISCSSTTSCIERSGNLSNLIGRKIVKDNKGKGLISRYKIGKLENYDKNGKHQKGPSMYGKTIGCNLTTIGKYGKRKGFLILAKANLTPILPCQCGNPYHPC